MELSPFPCGHVLRNRALAGRNLCSGQVGLVPRRHGLVRYPSISCKQGIGKCSCDLVQNESSIIYRLGMKQISMRNSSKIVTIRKFFLQGRQRLLLAQ